MTIARFEVPDWIRSVLICDPTDIWGNVVGIGLNELIACLSHAKRFDRRGSVFFLDTFSHGLGGYYTEKTGTGVAPVLTSNYAKSEGICVKMDAGTVSDDYSSFLRALPLPRSTKYGVEFSFTVSGHSKYIELSIFYHDGAVHWLTGFRYDVVNNKIQVLDSAGVYQDLVTRVLIQSAYMYHTAKLVFDIENKKLIRLLVDDYESGDLSAYGFNNWGVTGFYYMDTVIIHTGAGTGTAVIYVDDLTSTQNEPA